MTTMAATRPIWQPSRERIEASNLTAFIAQVERDWAREIGSFDALVSLHRSEGVGLHMTEAMWLGVPVIATRYSGNLDFMDDECALLVDLDFHDELQCSQRIEQIVRHSLEVVFPGHVQIGFGPARTLVNPDHDALHGQSSSETFHTGHVRKPVGNPFVAVDAGLLAA